MSTLIPNKQWSEIAAMNSKERRQMKACEVFDGEEYQFTLLPHNRYDSVVADNIRTKAEYLGASSNSIYPVEEGKLQVDMLEQAREGDNAPLTTPIALEGHKRKYRKKRQRRNAWKP